MKTELEEAAERTVKNRTGLHYFGNETSLENLAKKEYFIEGAKWQQEQDKNKYSDSEVLDLLKTFNRHTLKLQGLNIANSFNVKDWFEKFKQFKKK